MSLIKDMARIARDYRAFDDLAKMAERNGVRLISITEKIDVLPKRIHDDENGLDYTLNGDCYLPDIVNPQPEDQRPLGKWG